MDSRERYGTKKWSWLRKLETESCGMPWSPTSPDMALREREREGERERERERGGGEIINLHLGKIQKWRNSNQVAINLKQDKLYEYGSKNWQVAVWGTMKLSNCQITKYVKWMRHILLEYVLIVIWHKRITSELQTIVRRKVCILFKLRHCPYS